MMFPMDPVRSVRPPSWETHLLGPEQPGTRFLEGEQLIGGRVADHFPKSGISTYNKGRLHLVKL